MGKVPSVATIADAGERWRHLDIRSLLAKAALAIGAGSPTDAGVAWTLPVSIENPIKMAGGIPDPATLPVEDLKKELVLVLGTTPGDALTYGGVQGFEGLRLALAQRQSHLESVPLFPENFIVNNGGAGGITTICDAFVEPGDVVIVEGPTFSGSVRTFRGHMAEVIQVPMDQDGLVVEKVAGVIKQAIGSGKRVKLVYTICDFHNPTGTSLSHERRVELIRLCAEYQVLLVEDAAYAEIYFGSEAPTSLYSLAGGQGVLKVGTFSKLMATGLRIGWVQGKADFIDALVRVRFDMGNSPLLQRALAGYIASGKLEAHLDRMRRVYAEKCSALCASLSEHCSQYVEYAQPSGGFFLWVKCIGPSAQDVMRQAAEEGLVFPDGAIFFLRHTEDDTSHLRLAFSTATLEELKAVGPRLRAAFERAIGER